MRFVEKELCANSLAKEAQSLLNDLKHYNDSDRVREIIRILYSGCCSYCECSPEDGAFFQIEHFYPKGNIQYSKFEKIIENLHYSCQRCNSIKSSGVHLNIFSPNYYLDNNNNWQITPIEKIETELFYIGHLLFFKNIKANSINRGKKTIELFDLNNQNGSNRSSRQFLVENRIKVLDAVLNIIKALYELLSNYTNTSNNVIQILFSSLIKYTNRDSHYSTMIIHNYGSEIYKLMLIYFDLRKK